MLSLFSRRLGAAYLLVEDAFADITGQNNKGLNTASHNAMDEVAADLNVPDFDQNTSPLASTPRTFTSRAKALHVHVKGDHATDANDARPLMLR